MRMTANRLQLECMNEQEEIALPEGIEAKLKELLAIAGDMEDVRAGEVSVTFVNDEEIRELNRQYRGLDKSTDVLSFSMWETGEGEPEIRYEDEEDVDTDDDVDAASAGPEEEEEGDEADEEDDADEGEMPPDDPIGDIVISAATAKRQSEEYGHSLEREIGFLFVHGFLHLIGYDHQDEASEREMIEKQERVLQKAGLFR